MIYLHVSSAIKEINERGNTENVRSRWVSEVRYVDAEATVKIILLLL